MKYIEDCKIYSKSFLTEDIFELVLETAEIAKMSKPGQFVEIKVESLFLRRPISIGKVEGNKLYLYIKIVGKGTLNLSKIIEGDSVNIIGPLGNFVEPIVDKKVLLIGGGIGIAPLINIANSYENKYYSYLGFKEEQYGTEIFDEIGIENKYVIESKENQFVTDVVRENIKRIEPDLIISCGPMAMMKQVALIAKENNIKALLSLEEKMGCGFGACVGCSIEMRNGQMKKVCVDGPIFNYDEVNYGEW